MTCACGCPLTARDGGKYVPGHEGIPLPEWAVLYMAAFDNHRDGSENARNVMRDLIEEHAPFIIGRPYPAS